jgi:hypothetical protein
MAKKCFRIVTIVKNVRYNSISISGRHVLFPHGSLHQHERLIYYDIYIYLPLFQVFILVGRFIFATLFKNYKISLLNRCPLYFRNFVPIPFMSGFCVLLTQTLLSVLVLLLVS